MTDDRINQVFAAIPMGLILIDAQERVAYANAIATNLIGIGLVGRHYVTAIRQPNLLEKVEIALKNRESLKSFYKHTQTNQEIEYDVLITPVDVDGPSVLLSFEDISHQKRAGKMRRDFVANVSHELRTPLTSLLGAIETLNNAAKDDVRIRDRFLGIMQQEAERMNRLIQDLLSLSRVEADERNRPADDVDLIALLRSAAQSLAGVADTSSVEIALPDLDVPAVVKGDLDQLFQVFINLIENAVKYGGSPGRVTVKVTHLDHEPLVLGAAIRIDICDQGAGIDESHISRLTERFYRVDNLRSREVGGTGLGLAIVKHIVTRHRGRLRITSERGRGSIFSIILPAS